MSSTSASSAASSSAVPSSAHDLRTHLVDVFASCKSQGRPVYVAYMTAGFPSVDECVTTLSTLQQGGADIIELGVPFTDPMADGSVIQAANQVALKNGTCSMSDVITIAQRARAAGVTVPFVLMGYYNPFRAYGQDKLIHDCRAAGIAGFIIVDLPPEESHALRAACHAAHLSFIPLITPTTTAARRKQLVAAADSFLYVVSLNGTTGVRSSISNDLPTLIQNIREDTILPIAIGFGISSPETFQTVGKLGDGVVVGSALISCLQQAINSSAQQRQAALLQFCRGLTGRSIIHTVTPPLFDEKKQSSLQHIDNNMTGRFGQFGGRYVPETLVAALDELEQQYAIAKQDPNFHAEIQSYYDYIGRPSRLHSADRLTAFAGGARIYLKREDLNHTGAHKINNAISQAILSKRLGKSRLIAETGAGQHGVATATICAKLGIPLTVYMGAEDVERQSINVFKMELLGAKVVPVNSGSRTLKDAINEAMRDWVTNISTTHYLIGSAIGPHPFPEIVRDFQSVIGKETKAQMLQQTGRLPDAVVACVGGGSNAIGMFHPFQDDVSVRLVGVEAGGTSVVDGLHSATLSHGTPGVLHGTRTYLLQDEKGQITETHSISAGLDYPGVGPEHSHYKDIGRAEYTAVSDNQALCGFKWLTEMEGIIPALESSHAIFAAVQLAKSMRPDQNIVICVSGRGDKDIDTVRKHLKQHGLDSIDDAEEKTKVETR